MSDRLGVFRTADFERIAALPERPQEWSDGDLDAAIDALTEEFKTADGTMRLKRIQARALAEAMLQGKGIFEVGAGLGKFGIGALLFTAWNAKRGLLLVPAHLRQQTIDEWKRWSKHWKLLPLFDLDAGAVAGPHVRVLSYSALSTVRCAAFLDEYQPDVVVADEAHYLARTKSARGKRIFRYLRSSKKAGRPVKFVPMSGTMRRKSIRECSTLYEAALWDQSPFPTEYPDVEQWCFTLDEGVRDDSRIAPGALERFCTVEEIAEGINGVRRGVRSRVLSSGGVIASKDSDLGVSLVLQALDIEVPQKVKDALHQIRTSYTLPTGETFDAGLVAWAHLREAGCGFTYRYDPPAPEAWSKARKDWNSFVTECMEHPPRGMHLDSPLMVWNAVLAGKFGEPEKVSPWRNWKNIRDSFVPNPVPVWIDDFLVRAAEDYALKHNACVWVGHSSAFTKAESTGITDSDEDDVGQKFTRIPYFGAGKQGEQIRTYKGPCAASIRSHSTGKNLQQFSKALIMCLPSSGAALEQLLARHHREGQTADEVHVAFFLHTREMYQALVTSRKDAAFMNAMNGNSQRILYSTILAPDGGAFDDEPYQKLMESDDPLWMK